MSPSTRSVLTKAPHRRGQGTVAKATALATLLGASLLGSACASVRPTKARGEVDDLVEQRAGYRKTISAEQDEESRKLVRERVEQLAAEPLTVDSAVSIALLNNREFQAQLEDLGVAQADLVQAGLLKNPTIAGDLVNSTKGNGLGGGFSVSQSLLSVFLIPAQRRLAKSRLKHAVVTVGHSSLVLIHDVKIAYYNAQAARMNMKLQRMLFQAAEVGDDLATRQFEASNISALDRELFAAALDRARVAFADASIEAMESREELTRLLGLWGTDIDWRFDSLLDDELPQDVALDALESQAIAQRLDLSAARFEVASMLYAIKLRRRGLVPQIEVGLEGRNEVGADEGHEWVLGPGLALELPIFDPGHADLARLRAYLRQAEHRLAHLAVVVRSEIRMHRQELVAARRKVDYYRDTVLPRSATISDLTLEQYNAMLIGTYQLLETRADQVESQREYVHALRDYWVERADLELAAGGRLSADDS